MRHALVAAIAAALLATGSTAADAPDIAASLSCNKIAPQPDTLPGADSVTYKTAGGRGLRIHVFRPSKALEPPRPGILFFFGGGWKIGDIRAFMQQAETFARAGYVAAVADYRVTCRDNSTPSDSVADARSAYDWLMRQRQELGIDPERIVLSGGSAGGHLALVTAMLAPVDDKPAALVLFNPVVDLLADTPLLREVGMTRQEAEGLSPNLLPTNGLPPTIIMHEKEDATVPVQERPGLLRAAACGLPCELHEYVGRDHSFFNSREIDPLLSASPYEDTLSKALAFVNGLGVIRSSDR